MFLKQIMSLLFILGYSTQLFSSHESSCSGFFKDVRECCLATKECNPYGYGMSKIRTEVATKYQLNNPDYHMPRVESSYTECISLPLFVFVAIIPIDRLKTATAPEALCYGLVAASCAPLFINAELNRNFTTIIPKMEKDLGLQALQCASWQARIQRVHNTLAKRDAYVNKIV